MQPIYFFIHLLNRIRNQEKKKKQRITLKKRLNKEEKNKK